MVGMVKRVFIVNSFWKRGIGTGLYSNNRTHIKVLKNLVEVQLPGDDRLPVAPRVETPRDSISFTPLDQLLLNRYHSPTSESILVGGSKCMLLVSLTTSIDLSHHIRAD